MRKVVPTFFQIIYGSERKYWDVDGVRIMEVKHFDDCETHHKHDRTTEILFVIEGTILAINENERVVVQENEVIVFTPGEYHLVKPISKETRIIVFKFLRGDTIITDIISNDWIEKK